MSQIRHATINDAPGIARVMRTSGLDDTPDLQRIARVIPTHCTLVAIEDREITGFVDAFATTTANRIIRWEIDLLGVHPARQGRGIARQLVNSALEEGVLFGAQQTRALIRSDNLPSQRTFAWCNFKPQSIPFNLYVGSPQGGPIQNMSPALHLISICTLTYSGIWIEGKMPSSAFQIARAILNRYGWTVAGTLIPADGTETMRIAARAGYRLIGEFDWWVHT